MNNKTPSMFMGILLILYGLFKIFSFSQRDIFIGIALVSYGIGTMLIATQKPTPVRVGLIINFVTLILALAALFYERFVS